jgi:quercetin dioxygenase-like cupin family protein
MLAHRSMLTSKPAAGRDLGLWQDGSRTTVKNMQTGDSTPYEIAGYEILEETPELRWVVLTLAPGQEVPWHWHSNVTDRFFCMAGPMIVETRAPPQTFELGPGDTCAVPARRAHRVRGKDGGPCRFGVLQGVGAYDFNPVGG